LGLAIGSITSGKGDRIIVLLCGGDKSSQEDDIKQAKALAETWRQVEVIRGAAE